MNERIKELKRKAEALAYEEHKANCIKNGRDPSMPHANALNMTFEKFAELIVRECMDVARQQRNPANLNYKPSERFVEDLRQHFGV